MQTSTFKTSTIFVSTGKGTRVFQSAEDMPAELRKRMSENLAGPNTRTLIVADRRGREYLLKVLQRATHSSTGLQCVTAMKSERSQLAEAWPKAKRYWLEIALIGVLAAASWALLNLR
jgi:hypothetical protein